MQFCEICELSEYRACLHFENPTAREAYDLGGRLAVRGVRRRAEPRQRGSQSWRTYGGALSRPHEWTGE